ncbi:MAG TPA: 6-phosphofructokinase [Chitinophagaceae bacterium]|nr:MAG: 6-phosphofructokinase [Bacteroidetes bacterium OLB11]HMN33349.1 6-phosphofructokinase [Chitinophagaceae bacterium]
MKLIKNLGVLTSGGDSPGMNAAIRAIVRTALNKGLVPYGIKRGYQGMIQGDIEKIKTTDVSNIIQRGGTILKSARSKEFMTDEGMETAYKQLQKHQIDGLIMIGGDGTFRGAAAFSERFQIPSIGVPGTIDNDLNGTDFTIGFDTAVNTAVWAIDKIRDTAESHERVFIVEVMGRDAGYIALYSGIACGAEHIFVPEKKESLDEFLNDLCDDRRRKKLTNIIVIAEGDEFGGANELAKVIVKRLPIEPRVTILGHIQRGGSPTCFDRILSSRLGHAAVEAIVQGERQMMVGLVNNRITLTPFTKTTKLNKPFPKDMEKIIQVLSS